MISLGIERLEDRVVLAGEPFFGAASYSYSVNENAPSGTALGVVTATDPDAQPMTFSFRGGPFTIDENTGAIAVSGKLDFETTASYSLTVFAVDPDGNFGSSPVTITVGDVAGDPIFDLAAYEFSVNEDASAGFVIDNVSATGSGTLSYTIADDYGILAINSSTGQIILQSDLDHESLSSLGATVTVTDGSGLSTSAAVTVSIGDIDESPAGNQAPNVTSLSFSMTAPGQGLATGNVIANISDDFLTKGYFELQIDVGYDYTIEANAYAPASATSMNAEMQIPFGPLVQIAARVIETEQETGQLLYGDWFFGFVTVNPPANSVATLSTFAYTPGDEGYDGLMVSMSRMGYITADIADPTRLYGAYRIEYDATGDEIADDGGSLDLDATQFAFEFRGTPNTSYAPKFRVIEYDFNLSLGMPGYELVGGWESFSFTVPDFVNTPPDVDESQSNYQDFGYGMGMDGMGTGSLSLYFSDPTNRGNTIYDVDVDFDSDGIADFSSPLTVTSGPTSIYVSSGGPTGPTTIRIRVNESNPLPETLVGPWVEVGANGGTTTPNQAPVFSNSIYDATVYSLNLDPITNPPFVDNTLVTTITAIDTPAPKYSLSQPKFEQGPNDTVLPYGLGTVHRSLPLKALSIDVSTGQITIKNAAALAAHFKDHRDGSPLVVTVNAKDDQGATSQTSLEIYDDWKQYLTDAATHLSAWKLAMIGTYPATGLGGAVGTLRSAVATAQSKLLDFISSDWVGAFRVGAVFGAGATGRTAVIKLGATGASVVAAGGAAALGFLAQSFADHKDAGKRAVVNKATANIAKDFDAIAQEVNTKYLIYKNELAILLGSGPQGLNNQPDRKLQVAGAMEFYDKVKAMCPMPVNPVPSWQQLYKESLYRYGRSQFDNIVRQGDTYILTRGELPWSRTNFPGIIDAIDIVTELNLP